MQQTEDEEKPIANGEIKTEELTNGENVELNGHESECEESDDDDYLDHLLMLPLLDGDFSNRNKNLVSRSLLDLCTAIESRKEYQKIKQELLLNSATKQCGEEETPTLDENTPNLNMKIETRPPDEVTHETAPDVPETRRHSIRLKRALFGELPIQYHN